MRAFKVTPKAKDILIAVFIFVMQIWISLKILNHVGIIHLVRTQNFPKNLH